MPLPAFDMKATILDGHGTRHLGNDKRKESDKRAAVPERYFEFGE